MGSGKGSGKEFAERKRVVIVGGGISGAIVAKELQSHADVVLIDPKEYFEIPWAWLRSMVEPCFAERAVIDHAEYFKGTLVTASAVNVYENEVLTSEGRYISFDYLVIATGHTEAVPLHRIRRLVQFREDHQTILSSRSVLIIGGGPFGVELAGEIATDFPDKKIYLVHSGPRLMDFVGSKASRKSFEWLTSRKVFVYLNQTVDLSSSTGRTYRTSAGTIIEADCHFVCTGRKLGSKWLNGSILKDCLDRSGKVIVDGHLRVKGWNNIFAIGDITDVPEIKQGFYAQKHAGVVARNLKLLMNGERESRMSTYKAGKAMAMVSLGRKEAVAQLPIGTVTGFLPGIIKSKDLFVGKTRRRLGLESYV